MTYFKFLSIVLGSWMVLGGAWAAFSLESLRRLIVELYPEVRPRWIPVVGAAVLALVLAPGVGFGADQSQEVQQIQQMLEMQQTNTNAPNQTNNQAFNPAAAENSMLL